MEKEKERGKEEREKEKRRRKGAVPKLRVHLEKEEIF